MALVPEKDQLPVIRRQALDRRFQAGFHLPQTKHLVGGRAFARELPIVGFSIGGGEGAGPRPLFPEMVDRAVGGDPVHPGGEPVPGIVGRQGGVDLDEHLLRQVPGGVGLPGQAEQVVHQASLVPADQGLESGPVPIQRPLNIGFIQNGGFPIRFAFQVQHQVGLFLSKRAPESPRAERHQFYTDRCRQGYHKCRFSRFPRMDFRVFHDRLPVQAAGAASLLDQGGSVEAVQLPDRQKDFLLEMLAETGPDPEDWMERLRRAGREEGFEACAAALRFLANLVRSEDEAEQLLRRIMDHRKGLHQALGRDPGIQVSSVDYLSNVEAVLLNPKVVELSQFERTMLSASTDSLTGLYNRRYFRKAVGREIARCRRHRLTFSLLLMDLDHFKDLNDRYGHLIGDAVLRKVARCFREVIRDVDVPCRYGGEEFAVLLPETGRLGAYVVADRLRERIESDFLNKPTGGRITPITISGGIAVFPSDGREFSLLLERADEGLYKAKGEGRNRISLYHHERRRDIRYPYRGRRPVKLHPGTGAGGIVTRGVDISARGLLVETGESMDDDSRVRVILEGAPPAGGPWEIEGRVVRVVENGPTRRIGIALDRPIPEACMAHHLFTHKARADSSVYRSSNGGPSR